MASPFSMSAAESATRRQGSAGMVPNGMDGRSNSYREHEAAEVLARRERPLQRAYLSNYGFSESAFRHSTLRNVSMPRGPPGEPYQWTVDVSEPAPAPTPVPASSGAPSPVLTSFAPRPGVVYPYSNAAGNSSGFGWQYSWPGVGWSVDDRQWTPAPSTPGWSSPAEAVPWWQWQGGYSSPSPAVRPEPTCFAPPTPPQHTPSTFSRSLRVDPQTILYTKLCIYTTFTNGGLLKETADAIGLGVISPNSFPPIRVVEHRGHLYSLDNRRLWVFKTAKVPSIPVVVLQPYRKLLLRLETQAYSDTVELRWPQSLLTKMGVSRESVEGVATSASGSLASRLDGKSASDVATTTDESQDVAMAGERESDQEDELVGERRVTNESEISDGVGLQLSDVPAVQSILTESAVPPDEAFPLRNVSSTDSHLEKKNTPSTSPEKVGPESDWESDVTLRMKRLALATAPAYEKASTK